MDFSTFNFRECYKKITCICNTFLQVIHYQSGNGLISRKPITQVINSIISLSSLKRLQTPGHTVKLLIEGKVNKKL